MRHKQRDRYREIDTKTQIQRDRFKQKRVSETEKMAIINKLDKNGLKLIL